MPKLLILKFYPVNFMCVCIHSLRTALHGAVMEGHIMCVQLLIMNRANPGVSDINGWNAFHYVCVLCVILLELVFQF